MLLFDKYQIFDSDFYLTKAAPYIGKFTLKRLSLYAFNVNKTSMIIEFDLIGKTSHMETYT